MRSLGVCNNLCLVHDYSSVTKTSVTVKQSDSSIDISKKASTELSQNHLQYKRFSNTICTCLSSNKHTCSTIYFVLLIRISYAQCNMKHSGELQFDFLAGFPLLMLVCSIVIASGTEEGVTSYVHTD